ncbi:hypothetical protein ACH5RR_003913 [Cinchona calisaya]|uniref:Uncharacterized protein n=1 Tax=Cinchona calisaya TaxID=153742 RepID=A0ABD3AWW1_9GENT
MRYMVVIVHIYLLLMVIALVCRDVSTAAAASSSLAFLPGRRPMGKWSFSYKIQQGDNNLKGFSFRSIEQAAEHGVKSTNQDNSKAETQNSSNMDVEGIVYHIDYHVATTHPTPTPKHPKP